MKKLTTLVLALALAASLAVPAFAANTTTLTTTVPAATYTLNIPADQEIPYGAISTNIGNVTVTDSASFAEGKNLEVTVKKDSFKSDTTNTTIAFTLSLVNTSDAQSKVITDATPLLFKGQANGTVAEKTRFAYSRFSQGRPSEGYADHIALNIDSESWGKALAGNYSATITFTAEVVSG